MDRAELRGAAWTVRTVVVLKVAMEKAVTAMLGPPLRKPTPNTAANMAIVATLLRLRVIVNDRLEEVRGGDGDGDEDECEKRCNTAGTALLENILTSRPD